MTAGGAPVGRGAALAALALSAIAAGAFALRAIGFETVFPADGPLFAAFDGAYHVRLALWAHANFPAFLTVDPYLDWPHGAPVPWPPLQDLLAAAVARLAGGGERTVETVLVWLGPAAGAATALVVYAAARAVAGRGVALGAAALYAGFGKTVALARVGDADHHPLVALLGAGMLAAMLALLREDLPRARWLAAALALALARLGVVLAWNGSLLYLALFDGVLLAAGALTGRRALLRAQAAGLAAAFLVAAPVVAAWPARVGGEWSAVALSRLHLALLAGAALCAFALDALERARPAAGAPARAARAARAAALGLACAAALLALFPEARAGLAAGLRFVSLADSVGAATVEQFPLLPLPGRRTFVPPQVQYGWLAWAVPATPLLALLAAREARRRAPALALAAIAAVLAALTVDQNRYGNEFAAAGAIAFALGFGALANALPGPAALRGGAVVALAALAIGPGLRGAFAAAPASWRAVRGAAPGAPDPVLTGPIQTLVRFAHLARAATPETGGFLAAAPPPEYGILAPANLGHAIRAHARRPAPIDGFWDYLDPAHFALANGFYALRDEDEAVARARALRTPYVVTAAQRGGGDTVARRLHDLDGAGRGGQPRLARFRLVTEGPEGGYPFEAFGARVAGGAVYKLFEVVEGAVLAVRAEPGAAVGARLDVVTPTGRRFTHVADAVAGADGVARVRVPLPSSGAAPTRAVGPWRVRTAGGGEAQVEVSEQAVRSGAEIAVAPR